MPWTESEERREVASVMRDSDFIRMLDARIRRRWPSYAEMGLWSFIVEYLYCAKGCCSLVGSYSEMKRRIEYLLTMDLSWNIRYIRLYF